MILFPEFHDRYGPWALIAGASEGIGFAYANALGERGLNLILLARRQEALQSAATLLRRRHRVEVVTASVDLASDTLSGAVDKAIGDRDVGLLVYNACYSCIAPFNDTTEEDHRRMLAVNCAGPLALCRLLAPRLCARGKGGIILMSSMSGFQGSALIASYAATKAFNTNLGQGLWTELGPQGVDVTTVVAGATLTPGFEATTPKARQAKAFPMRPDAVAREGLSVLGRRPVHVVGRLNRAVDIITSLMTRAQRTQFFSKATEDIYGQ